MHLFRNAGRPNPRSNQDGNAGLAAYFLRRPGYAGIVLQIVPASAAGVGQALMVMLSICITFSDELCGLSGLDFSGGEVPTLATAVTFSLATALIPRQGHMIIYQR